MTPNPDHSELEPAAGAESGRVHPESNNIFLASIAISLKRIADLLDETDTDRRIEIAAQKLSET